MKNMKKCLISNFVRIKTPLLRKTNVLFDYGSGGHFWYNCLWYVWDRDNTPSAQYAGDSMLN